MLEVIKSVPDIMIPTVKSRTLVLGIGNPILHDDGIGPLVVNQVEKRFHGTGVDFLSTNLSGVQLMDLLTGYDSLVIVDAIQRGEKPGTIRWLKSGDFKSGESGYHSQHRVGILQALELAREMGQSVPAEIDIMAIEVMDLNTFGEDITPEVERTLPAAVEEVLNFLEKHRDC